uniref:Putative secreted protein n=1 Tax=Anopheles marajoara TaxID=58244 RepID=A0A2M4CDA7_9DIPT
MSLSLITLLCSLVLTVATGLLKGCFRFLSGIGIVEATTTAKKAAATTGSWSPGAAAAPVNPCALQLTAAAASEA